VLVFADFGAGQTTPQVFGITGAGSGTRIHTLLRAADFESHRVGVEGCWDQRNQLFISWLMLASVVGCWWRCPKIVPRRGDQLTELLPQAHDSGAYSTFGDSNREQGMKDPSRFVASHRFVRHALAMLVLAGMAVAGDAMATTYRVVVLPIPEGSRGFANDLNAAGEVAGAVSATGAGSYAVSWSPPDYAMRVLPSEGNTNSTVIRISDGGDIIGNAYFPDGSQANVMWKSDGTFVRMAQSARRRTPDFMTDINLHGTVVGWRGRFTSDKVVVWPNPQTLRVPAAIPDANDALAVNDSGMVVGLQQGIPLPAYAFRWTAGGGFQLLGDLPGGEEQSAASDVNNSGQIVGDSISNIGKRAVLWDADGTIHDLGDLPGVTTNYNASRINNFGDVIGSAEGGKYWLWTAGTGMLSIESLIDPNDPMHGAGNFNLSGINDAGMISATLLKKNGLQTPVLLIPQP